ncbi:MAG: hypothetical protein Q7T19_04585 [Caulobacter sp.]|nr:hypothetical protein [Caulobacter sp.]
MKKFMILATGVALSLALGTSGFTQDAPAPAPMPETAPPPEATPAPEAAPAPGETAAPAPAAPETGRIVFFRPGRLSGAIYTYYIVETDDDGKPAKDAPRLGGLPNGGAFILDVEPGIHSYNITGPMAVNKAEDRLRLEVEPGETYYVEQTVRMGLVTGGFRLVPGDEARFKASKVKLDKGAK